jgi:hypothetical protein
MTSPTRHATFQRSSSPLLRYRSRHPKAPPNPSGFTDAAALRYGGGGDSWLYAYTSMRGESGSERTPWLKHVQKRLTLVRLTEPSHMDAAGGTMRTLLDGVAQLEDMTRAQPAVSEESLSAQLQALVGAASLLPNTAGNDGKHRLDTVAIAKRMWCAHPAPRLVVGFCQTRALVPRLGDAKSSLGDAESSLGDAESSLGDAESSLGGAKSSLGDAKSSLGDAKSSLGDAKSSLGDAKSSAGTSE